MGDEIDDTLANYDINNENAGGPTVGGSYPANGYGLYDIAGNVLEWCRDRYAADYYQNSPSKNPVAGAKDSKLTALVLWGGSWDGNATGNLRVSARKYAGESAGKRRTNTIGFRGVKSGRGLVTADSYTVLPAKEATTDDKVEDAANGEVPSMIQTLELAIDAVDLTENGTFSLGLTILPKDDQGQVLSGEKLTMTASSGQISPAVEKEAGVYTATYTVVAQTEPVVITAQASNGKTGSIKIKGPTPNRFKLNLKSGLNMISLPLDPMEVTKPDGSNLVVDSAVTSKDLTEWLGATVVYRFDTVSQRFVPFIPEHLEENNFNISGGIGVIVNVKENKEIIFTGSAWSNTPLAAPSISRNPVWAFTVLCQGQSLRDDLEVTNLSRGVNYPAQWNEGKQLGFASMVDSTQQAVISSGDLIQVTANGQRWRYRVSEPDLANAFVDLVLGDELRVPDQTHLRQNYPNPFNPDTWIPFELSEDTEVNIEIYDLSGQPVRRMELGFLWAGVYASKELAAYWDGKTGHGERASSGI